MKKIISILIILCIMMTVLCVVASAESTGNSAYTFETDEAHYTVEFNDNNLTEQQQMRIAEKLIGNDDMVQTCGLGCTLFGHDYKYTSANVITHKYRSSSPRCKKDMYNVTYCEDCDYTEETLTTTTYIVCCD